ncbi:GNAT family N-acetyltransferase [bacterium]|jgi:GNAT superfamily N-acetyltransferase|nr:GNAT family N-acetyltransferase [bacterium]MBT4597936.1 GNAT family N-acetyltransferase [bacterium]MBT7037203.1 GNAT family N-acetyltransferase [bacterium]MBT7431610.1 GNAT family N-acetyltransferase [bacterium]MBT7993066.1 GNAT family N-acetyltransferase [bacterium]
MEISEEDKICLGKQFSIKESGEEIGRASLYLVHNNLHSRPFAFLEDVFIHESRRGSGLGTKLVDLVIKRAKELNCYKLIATSRNSKPKVHRLYRKIGFEDYGKEFRINL